MTFLNLLSFEKFQGFGYQNINYYYYMDNETPPKIITYEFFKLKLSCDYDFETFPFDKHYCDLSFVDWRYGIEELIFNTTRKIVFGDQHLTFDNKSSLILTSPKTSFKISAKINSASTTFGGLYSSTGIRFNLERKSISLLLGSFYVPTGIFSILSMASFVINPDLVISF